MSTLRGEYRIRFKGGPIGGTEQTVETLPPSWRVPVMTRTHSQIAGYTTLPLSFPTYESHEYREDRFTRRCVAPQVWETVYEWVDPTEYIRAEAQKWKSRALAAETQLEEEGKLREAVKVIAGIVNN